MERRALLSVLGVVGLAGLSGCIERTFGTGVPATDGQPNPARQYPDGAGLDHIDFSALTSDDHTVLHAPAKHWDSYAIIYNEPPERRRVEGDYYINSVTGEVITDRWHGATDYRDGDTYAYVQPAERIPDDRQRERLESDPAFVYDDVTDAYYRYDRHYGRVAPTNLGRHTDVVEPYDWTATDTATYHGVPVITYDLSGTAPEESTVPPARTGSLELGAEDGLVYAFDVTLDLKGEPRYTYAVRPAAFPDHGWVETARTVAAANTTTAANRSADGSCTPDECARSVERAARAAVGRRRGRARAVGRGRPGRTTADGLLSPPSVTWPGAD